MHTHCKQFIEISSLEGFIAMLYSKIVLFWLDKPKRVSTAGLNPSLSSK